MNQKFFTEKQIYAATVLGGPIPPGFLIFMNLKRLGENRKASLALVITFILTSILFFLIINLPASITDKIPNIAFTSLYTIAVYAIYHPRLSKMVDSKIDSKDDRVSNWSVAGLTFIGIIANLLIILLFASTAPSFPGEKYQYGLSNKHEIFYDEGRIDKLDLPIVGRLLTQYGYFAPDVRSAAKIEKSENEFILKLEIQKGFWNQPDLIELFNELKTNLYIETGKTYHLVLISYDLSGNIDTKRI